ncbi:sensor histidine kinase [Conexibacter sp. SYSU D00693]|uniref:sensor histidine kinase n=1 Tax=Conexibacter sp. SYSU D00693 TaxID=2812560 RepID=UPI00196AEA36|nr:sensor histidine kinase [Conexibacter sp. SYSU D00693]
MRGAWDHPALRAAVPVLLGLFYLVTVQDAGRGPLLTAVGSILALVQAGAVAARHRHLAVAVAVGLPAALGLQLIAPEVLVPFGALFLLWAVTVAHGPATSVPMLLVVLGLLGSVAAEHRSEDVLFLGALTIALWALAEAWRGRARALEEAGRRALADEQARIARELHDVLAHSVSVIVVQAAAADDVFDDRPDQARAALRAIEAAGRDALGELRRLLSAVRPGAEEEATAPAPRLAELDALAAPLRHAGLEVAVRRDGEARPLPAGVELSAYRIVQEALTNTLRHAGATRADVRLHYAPEALELEVVDDGRGAAAATRTGRGISGMRERAALVTGTLEAGPHPDGGFRVHARLPVEAAR